MMSTKFTRTALFISSFKRVPCLSDNSLRRNLSNTSSRWAEVGFIGLGNMGSRMAANLLSKGHKVTVFDVNSMAVNTALKQGATNASSPAEIASKLKTIVTMLPASQHVTEVYNGQNGIFNSMKPGTLMLDCSTIDANVSRELATLAEGRSAVFMDAPVSGGVGAAQAGTLTFMVGGGNKDHFDRAKGVLQDMGKNVVYCGAAGNGQAAKICNNMLLAIEMIGVSEAMNLGMKLGLEPKLLLEIINMASGQCWTSKVYSPVPGTMENVPSARQYSGGFGTALMSKDLGLAMDAASQVKAPTPLGSLANNLYKLMVNSGFAPKDFSSVFQFIQGAAKNK